jgi:hypothetical protein
VEDAVAPWGQDAAPCGGGGGRRAGVGETRYTGVEVAAAPGWGRGRAGVGVAVAPEWRRRLR